MVEMVNLEGRPKASYHCHSGEGPCVRAMHTHAPKHKYYSNHPKAQAPLLLASNG